MLLTTFLQVATLASAVLAGDPAPSHCQPARGREGANESVSIELCKVRTRRDSSVDVRIGDPDLFALLVATGPMGVPAPRGSGQGGKYAVIGALLGAAIGALVYDHQCRDCTVGAVGAIPHLIVGAAAGAGVGFVITLF